METLGTGPGPGDVVVEALNTSILDATSVNTATATTESLGPGASSGTGTQSDVIGITLSFNSIGWESQNFLFNTIDALFGTGLVRPLEGEVVRWVERFNESPGPKLCVDIPSGLHGDTGEVLGVACRGDRTVTFAAAKHGLLTADAAAFVGELVVAGLGIPEGSPIPDA